MTSVDRTPIVTPEAVPLDFNEAGVGSRGLAILLDWLVLGAAMIALMTASGLVFSAFESSGAVVASWFAVMNLLLLFGYPITCETLTRGKTLGKLVMGLRVVTAEGAPVRFRHAGIRAALGLVDFGLTLGVAAVLSSLLTQRSQRLGDLVAGTIVLRERTAGPRPSAARFTTPPAAEPFAATLDTGALTARDYETVRAFLLRAGELDADARTRLAQRLADLIVAKLGQPPPGRLTALDYLASVAARYQQAQRGH
ncbi:MAG: RDD family protein [Egibacteraceae bacterium]